MLRIISIHTSQVLENLNTSCSSFSYTRLRLISCEIIMRVSEEKRRLLPGAGDPGAGVTSDQCDQGPPAWWGWVVVTASFYCIAVLDGVGYTTGVMLDSLLRDLGGGRGEVSLVGSMQVSLDTTRGQSESGGVHWTIRESGML